MEGKGAAEIHGSDSYAGGHQAVDDAFAEARRQLRRQSMAKHLLHEAIANRDRAGHGKMRQNVSHEPDHAERTRPTAVEFRHRANESGSFIKYVKQVDDGARADGGDDGYPFRCIDDEGPRLPI